MNQVTKEDTQRFRDQLLDKGMVSTAKTKIGCVAGLFELAVEEGLLHINPFKGITKRLESPKSEIKEHIFDPQSDVNILKLPQDEQDIYWLIRFTGMRVAEAAGLQLSDINLADNVIDLVEHSDRPLKTKTSARWIPIHPKLIGLLQRLKAQNTRPFIQFYKPEISRWVVGTNWKASIGANPHLLRHHAATSMRNAGFDDYIIGRALGHSTGSTMTSQYKAVDFERVRKAIESISCMVGHDLPSDHSNHAKSLDH